MDESILKDRFMRWALSVYELTKLFPKETVYFVVERQMIRSSSSSAANYRASCRGKSRPDFINKLRIAEEEIDETIFWLEYTNKVNEKWLAITRPHMTEGNELLSIVVASIKTCLSNIPKK